MNKAYIAAPIFTKDQLRVVSSITMMLKLDGWEYFSPYENSQPKWAGRAPKDCPPEVRKEVLNDNIVNLMWTELLIACVGLTEDGRTDTGVVWEMGHFHALMLSTLGTSTLPRTLGASPLSRKLTLAYIHPEDKRQQMNLMLAGTVNAVAYGPAQLHYACELLRRDKLESCITRFDPEVHIIHEQEPVA